MTLKKKTRPVLFVGGEFLLASIKFIVLIFIEYNWYSNSVIRFKKKIYSFIYDS